MLAGPALLAGAVSLAVGGQPCGGQVFIWPGQWLVETISRLAGRASGSGNLQSWDNFSNLIAMRFLYLVASLPVPT